MKQRPALSVVIPVYNEEESVRPLYEKSRNACDAVGQPYEIIFVDDGSRDRTGAVLEEIHHSVFVTRSNRAVLLVFAKEILD